MSAVRQQPAAAFDRRLVPPMILGALLNPVNSSMIAVALVSPWSGPRSAGC